jgi:hypothetical protein
MIYRVQCVYHPQWGHGTRILAGGGIVVWGNWSTAKGIKALTDAGMPHGSFAS